MKHKSNIVPLVLVAVLIIVGAACKSKKKVSDISDPNEKQEMPEKEPVVEEPVETPTETTVASKEDIASNEISKYFSAIANAPSTASANKSINEALTLFSSPDTPVLIIINESNGKKDYDRPTTIKEYLNYLKDQKKNPAPVYNLKLDGSNKVQELELKRKLN